MERMRALGNIERGCWLIDQTAPMNVLAVAQVAGRLDPARLAAALELLQRRHPLLRVCVQLDRGVPTYFYSAAPIPFSIVSRRDGSHFHELVTDERNRPFHADQAPLLRLTVLHGQAESELVFTMHHLISDGASSTYLLRDMLLALSGDAPAASWAPLSVQPALEDLMPAAERGFSGRTRSAQFLYEQAFTFFVRRPRLLREQQPVPSGKRLSAVSHQQLSRDQTTGLLGACRQQGVTLHGAICAALLLAVGAEVRAEAATPDPLLGCCTPVNLRRVLQPQIGQDMGLYVGPIVTFHRLPADRKLPSLAAELTRQIHAARAASVPTQALATQSRLLPSWVSPQQAARHLYNRLFGTVSVTNMGVLDIPLSYGDLRLTAVHIGGSNNPFGSLISIGVTTLAGQLFMNFNYNQHIVSDDRLQRVVTATMGALSAASRPQP